MLWRCMGECRHSSTILDLDTRWRWVARFAPRPLYSQGKSPRYPLDRRLGGPQSQPGRCIEETNRASARIWTPAIQVIAHCYTDLTALTARKKYWATFFLLRITLEGKCIMIHVYKCVSIYRFTFTQEAVRDKVVWEVTWNLSTCW
jgi:hypothetical protein